MGTKLLRQWRGATRPEQVDRLPEVQRRTVTGRHGHNVYRNTKVTSRAQEEQSAMPAGVTNQWEDSDDDEAWGGADSKELDAEWQALRAAKYWLSDNGPELQSRDAAAEALAMGAGEVEVDLSKPTDEEGKPLTWDDVRRMLDEGAGGRARGFRSGPARTAAGGAPRLRARRPGPDAASICEPRAGVG